MGYPKLPPVEGYVTRGLQLENNHLGIDIATINQNEAANLNYQNYYN